VAIRRSVLLIKAMGEGQRLEVGPPKSGRSRMVDLDDRTLAALTVHRSQLRALSALLAQDDAYVLGRLDGGVQHPERLSRSFAEHRQSAAARYGIELPAIRLHDLRHTHATLYLRAGIDSKIVSEGLGTPTCRSRWTSTPTPSRRCSERQPRRSPRWSTERRSEPRSITAVSRGPNQQRQVSRRTPDLRRSSGQQVSEGRLGTYAHACCGQLHPDIPACNGATGPLLKGSVSVACAPLALSRSCPAWGVGLP
jgi:hypothetical protein